MADFDAATKETAAVFLKRLIDGKVKYTREPYNLVTYNQHKTNAFSAIEGKYDPSLYQLNNATPVNPTEEYDQILVVDKPLFNGVTRFGQV